MEPTQGTITGTRGKEYPYILRTDFSIRPDKVSHETYGHFICIPDPTSRTKTWGFEDEAGMGLFRLDFSGCIVNAE